MNAQKNDREFWASAVAGIKKLISKNEQDLDKAGIERKALTPELVDGLRDNLCEAIPAMCEGDGEAVAEIIQVIVDTLAEAQPESDVPEEDRAEGEEDERAEDEEEKDGKIAALTQEMTDMGKAYVELIADVSEVVQATHKALETISAKTKSNDTSYDELKAQMAALETRMGERPRRASQAPETKIDPESELATSIKERDTSGVPDAFADMFEGAS